METFGQPSVLNQETSTIKGDTYPKSNHRRLDIVPLNVLLFHPRSFDLTIKKPTTPTAPAASSHSQAPLPLPFSVSSTNVVNAVKVGWRVEVGLRVGLGVWVGNGVSVGGRGVKVAVAGGVTCSSSFSPG